MSVKVKLLALAAGAALPCLFAVAAQSADETFTKAAVINLPNGQSLGSFDISFVDPALSQYFLADRTNQSVDVIDTSSNTVTKQLMGCNGNSPCTSVFVGNSGNSDTSGPNGVITVDHKVVWAGDGNSRVQVIDIATDKVLATIPTGTSANRADELCVDPQHEVVLIANDADDPPFITFISTDSFAVLGKITMDGTNGTPLATNGIEQCQWSPRTKKFYLNIPQVGGTPGANDTPGAVLEINPASLKIEKTFVIPFDTVNTPPQDCRGPAGMAIGPDRAILLGCSNSGTASVIINEITGNIINTLGTANGQPGESGADEVWFNPGDNQYFLANGNHKTGAARTPQLGVVDPNGNQDTPATTARGSHSVAADPVHNNVYVPVNNVSPGGLNNPSLCSGTGTDGNPASPSKGCIVVFSAANDDPGLCVADDDGAGHSGDRSDPVFIRSVCPPSGDHD